jgi:hypothetical protein
MHNILNIHDPYPFLLPRIFSLQVCFRASADVVSLKILFAPFLARVGVSAFKALPVNSYLHLNRCSTVAQPFFGRSRFLLEAKHLPPPNPPPWVPLACAAQGTADGQRGQLWA